MGLFNLFTANVKSSKKLLPEEIDLQEKLKIQNQQIEAVKAAEAKFETDNDMDALIDFLEEIWRGGGLHFNGSKWTFRLPDLYIKQKRYDDALRILNKIKNPNYQDKKSSYIEKVNNAKKEAPQK